MSRSLAHNLDDAVARHSSRSRISSFHGSEAASSQKLSKESTCRTDILGKKSGAYRNAAGIAATVIQGLSATVISQYDSSHSGLVRHPLPRNICLPSLTSSCSTLFPLPQALLDPSSTLFAKSVMVFGLAVLASYRIQGDDGFQDHILGFGAVLGFLITGLIATSEGGGGAIKDYLPAFITLSLLASRCGHAMFGTV